MSILPSGGIPTAIPSNQNLVPSGAVGQERTAAVAGTALGDTQSLQQGQDTQLIAPPEAAGGASHSAPSRANMESVFNAMTGAKADVGTDEPAGPIAFVPKMVAEAYATMQTEPYSSTPSYSA